MTVLNRFIFAIFLLASEGRAFCGDLPLDISSKIVDTKNKLVLELLIVNNGKEFIRLYRSDLPWGNVRSTLLLLVKTDKLGTVMQQDLSYADPGPETILIDKNKPMKGEINVYHLFPNLAVERAKSDYLLFWSYQGRDVDGNLSLRAGGMYVLPKKQLSKVEQ